MEWCLGLDGRSFHDLEAQKQSIIQRALPNTDEGWCAVAALGLEIVGLRHAVRMGDPRLWRQALSELDTLPLSPLNLPLPVWDLYHSHPFESVTLRLVNGKEIAVPDWSQLFYSWHCRQFAIREDKVVQFFGAADVVGGDCIRPPATQTTTLERLRWLKAAEKPMSFVVRTRQGRTFVVEGPNRFQLDPSASLLALRFCDNQPFEFIPVAEIAAVVLTNTEPRVVIELLQQRLKAIPFLPFQVLLLQGSRYTVKLPQDVLITLESIFLGQGRSGSEIHENAIEIPLTWIDRLEVLPS